MTLSFDNFYNAKTSGFDSSSFTKKLIEHFRSNLIKDDLIKVPNRSSIVNYEPFYCYDAIPALSIDLGIYVVKIGRIIENKNTSAVKTTVLVYSTLDGSLIKTFDGDFITHIKSSAITGLITDVCSFENSKTLGIIGSGMQARTQIEGICAIRNITKIKIFSRSSENIRKLISEYKARKPYIEFVECNDVISAIKNVDIISTATTSFKPLLSSELLESKSIHINCVGNYSSDSREIPNDILSNSFIVVEDLDTALSEIGNSHKSATSIKKVLQNQLELKNIKTVFSSTGYAALDLLTVHFLLQNKL